ncbi:putative f-box domain protein [Fusarium austroafricanum]|uniref:Putative f-box domain protein n=1 Tax=Fusarium austroafricanum TaxID=2364996 RepID=A0A8H4NDM4_9HYPO|nr:putative f-box domain protein [Fusarium austroafricanum]
MMTTAALHGFPPEIICHITSFLPQTDLKNLRFADRTLSGHTTRQLFRSTRLLARAKDGHDPQRFIQLAKSNLSGLAREVSCDFSNIVHNGFIYTESKNFELLPVFLDALPLLTRFRNLRTLHLCFDSDFSKCDFDLDPTIFRQNILVPVFRILAGTWTKKNTSTNQTTNDQASVSSQDIPSSRIPLSTLIISNLEDYHDPYLINMPEFKTVISGIKALRLDIAQRREYIPEARMKSTTVTNQCQEMFTQLPQTWLSLPIAANLRALSLYYQS